MARAHLRDPSPNKPLHRAFNSSVQFDWQSRLASYWVEFGGTGQRCCWPLNADPSSRVAELRLKRGLVLLGNISAFVLLADGLAMVLTPSTSTLGGLLLLGAGASWFMAALPRVVRQPVRPFVKVLVPKLGAVALPLLFIPVCGLWFVATPSALTAWFAVAWAALWLGCVFSSVVVPCPRCGRAYGRNGSRPRPLCQACVHCGAAPRSSAA